MPRLLEPGERPGAWDTIGDLAKRVARLEAVPGTDPDADTVAYAFGQVSLYTVPAGSSGFHVPDGSWDTTSYVNPLGITFSGGVWTISVPGIYVASAGCRFAVTDMSVTGGIFNFSLSVPSGNVMDMQTSLPSYLGGEYEANPGNSMMWDTGAALSFNEVHHEFLNTADVDVDVGFVNVNIWRIADSTS